jgi:hypothetical protein
MRRLALFAVLTLAGCNLYFGPDPNGGSGGGTAWPPPDAGWVPPPIDASCGGLPDATPGPDAPPPGYTFATCVDGELVKSGVLPTDVAPADLAHTGTAFQACGSRCRAPVGVYECLDDASCSGAAQYLCEPDTACPADGACTGTGTSTCSTSGPGCAIEVQTEVCTCSGGKESCASPCTDGLCSPLEVVHALAGHWQGTVYPPSFASPYQVDLVIGKDGHLDPHVIGGPGYYTAFYYGQDGPDPNRWFQILAETPTGAIGTVGVEFSPQEILPGLVTGVHVTSSKLHFTFWDSWLDCSRPFVFDLTRVP